MSIWLCVCVSGFRPRFLERRSPSDSGAALISTRHLQLYLCLSVCFPHYSVHSHNHIFIELLWYWLWNTGCRINEISCLMSEKRGFDPSENEMHFRSAFFFNEGSWRVLAFCGVLVPDCDSTWLSGVSLSYSAILATFLDIKTFVLPCRIISGWTRLHEASCI